MIQQQPVAIFLMGPTASGKTELAMELIKRLPCEIISVDSALVYRDMNIGTAKPTQQELLTAPHHLIDICNPDESYSAARFRADALEQMQQISAAGRIPLLVGGTMLYFRALQYGLSPLPEADAAIRALLLSEAQHIGWHAMHQQLQRIDPVAAQRIHPNDPQRIQRALEVYRITGEPMTKVQQHQQAPLPYRLLKLVWAPFERELLRERIALRFQQMLAQSFEQEVRTLLACYQLNAEMPSMRSVGYRQMLQYINDEIAYQQMIDSAITATRQLAKRQVTWLRKEDDAIWLKRRAEVWEHLQYFGVH